MDPDTFLRHKIKGEKKQKYEYLKLKLNGKLFLTPTSH